MYGVNSILLLDMDRMRMQVLGVDGECELHRLLRSHDGHRIDIENYTLF